MTDKDEILVAIAAMQQGIDDLKAATVAGFAKTEERFQKMEDRQLFLERKIDNRFDLLERMMVENRRQDTLVVQELAVRVQQVEATIA